VVAIPTVLIRALAVVPRASSEAARIIIIAVPNPRSKLAQVVITIAVARAAATSCTMRPVGVPFVVA
jgi:hypothetical protein